MKLNFSLSNYILEYYIQLKTKEGEKDCEVCNTTLENEGTRLYCPNEACSKRIYYHLKKFHVKFFSSLRSAFLNLEKSPQPFLKRFYKK